MIRIEMKHVKMIDSRKYQSLITIIIADLFEQDLLFKIICGICESHTKCATEI